MLFRFVLVGLLFLGLSGPCGAALLSFTEFSEIGAERIRVGDIAKVKGDMPGVAELLNLDLGQAPYPGRIERVKVSNIMAWIKRRLPQFEQLKWEGPTEVALRTKEHTILFDEVVDLTQKTIVTRLGVTGKEIVLDAMTRRRDLVVPDRGYQLVVTRMEADKKCQRLATVTHVVANGRILTSLPLQFSLISGTKELDVDQPTDMSNTLDVIKQNDQLAQADEACNRIKKNIVEQQEVGSNTLAIRQLSPITVELRAAGLILETSGIALGNAGVGDLIRVRPPEGSGQYLARVVAPGRVFVTTGTVQ